MEYICIALLFILILVTAAYRRMAIDILDLKRSAIFQHNLVIAFAAHLGYSVVLSEGPEPETNLKIVRDDDAKSDTDTIQ